MRYIQTTIFMAALLLPIFVSAHECNRHFHPEHSWRGDQGYSSTEYYHGRNYDKEHRREKYRQPKKNKIQRHREKAVKSGWNVRPDIAKRAPNCYRYTLSTRGGKGSARITSISGKNYIQVNGKKSGYVCFSGTPPTGTW